MYSIFESKNYNITRAKVIIYKFYTMMKKRLYQSPRATFTDVEQERIICASPVFNVQVKDYNNINDYSTEEAPEDFYFKS